MFINNQFFNPILNQVKNDVCPQYNEYLAIGLAGDLPVHMAERLQEPIKKIKEALASPRQHGSIIDTIAHDQSIEFQNKIKEIFNTEYSNLISTSSSEIDINVLNWFSLFIHAHCEMIRTKYSTNYMCTQIGSFKLTKNEISFSLICPTCVSSVAVQKLNVQIKTRRLIMRTSTGLTEVCNYNGLNLMNSIIHTHYANIDSDQIGLLEMIKDNNEIASKIFLHYLNEFMNLKLEDIPVPAYTENLYDVMVGYVYNNLFNRLDHITTKNDFIQSAGNKTEDEIWQATVTKANEFLF